MTTEGRLPDFVVAGVPRASTTTLAAHLRELDEVVLPPVKEPHFFSLHRSYGLDWYAGLYRGARPDQRCGDITPAYLVHPGAVADMAQTLPDAKVVVVLRNPVDRAYSHFWLNQWKGVERNDFEGGLAAEPDRLRRNPRSVQYAYVRSGHYARWLRELYDHVPEERVHVVLFDDMVANLGETLAGVCRHIGVTPPDRVEKKHTNHHGPVRSVWVSTVARHVPGPACRTLRRWNSSPGKYPPMAPETRARLVDAFAADHADLVDLLGRALPWGAQPDVR